MAESNIPPQPWSFDPSLSWKAIKGQALIEVVQIILPDISAQQLPADVELYVMELPFYRQYKLYCLRSNVEGELRHCFMLNGKDTVLLNGASTVIHYVNIESPLEVTSKNVSSYIRFFGNFVHGDLGPFSPVEDVSVVRVPDGLDAQSKAHAQKCEAILKSVIAPMQRTNKDTFDFSVYIKHSDAVFICQLQVYKDGNIEMKEDVPIAGDIPKGMLPQTPKLYALQDVLVGALGKGGSYNPYALQMQTNQTSKKGKSSKANNDQKTIPHSGNITFKTDRDITHCFMSVLIKNALEKNPNADVIIDFNKSASSNDDMFDFAQFVFRHGPVVVIESDFAYIEEMVAQLLIEPLPPHENKPTVVRYGRGDSNIRDQAYPAIIVISADELRVGSAYDAPNFERMAFDISSCKHPILIGTNHLESLPDAFEKVMELTLRIPKLNERLFKIVFDRIFDSDLPRGWQKRGTQWLQYLSAHDFHQPCKAGLNGAKAYNYLYERVKNRLQSVESNNGPNLQDLHGMAEAKQMAEDLISDIQGALKGQLPWSAVDRGMLLAGPPGTGKTTLAKAIAKACGVRFIAVSAATWQSAGALPEHLRAMRATFAEARRYAPSILFIDEVDSFSNRENQVGHNASYFTDVVNALLAEIQGFDEQQPVFVIGATNFPHKVDPALRRAGRLDKLVYIPHPNVEALSSIYKYYLDNKELVGIKANDIDTKFLGGMSFGLTGADVETHVRGAVRRARKDQKPLCQHHLIDEITGKSRSQNTNRLDAEEMQRIAVHESGHALLQLLCGSAPIAYMSIVPRENGSLGFVANMPSSQNMRTRKQYLEHLQVVLAGRAAEEIVYGKDNISGGAGGDSQQSDLAVATRLATNLVCNLGMGKTSTLIWGNTPSAEQQEEIEKLLQEAYSTALAKLEAHRNSLDELKKALIEKQELMGDEVSKIINFTNQEYRLPS